MRASGRLTAAAGVVLALLTGVAATAPAAAGTGSGSSGLASVPGVLSELGVDGGLGDHELFGVDAIAPDAAFAVGVGGSQRAVRARHWNGTRWAPTRPLGGPLSELYDVSVISSRDVWATGNAQGRALAIHWDGDDWTRVPTPPNPDAAEYLTSVDGTSPDDVWAVGYAQSYESNDFFPVIEHWDGTEWARVPYELPGGATMGLLRGVTAVSATEAWAVGHFTGNRGGPMLLHWDGSSWESMDDIVEPSHDLVGVEVMFAVDAVSADDVWAVGAGSDGPTLLHWDGRVWTRTPAPTGTRDWLIDSLFGVAAVSADDVWAVGGYGADSRPDRARILHFDGARWRRVHTPNPGRTGNALYGVSGTGSNDAWAVGTITDDFDATNQYLILHWDGARWTRARFGHFLNGATELSSAAG